MNRMPYTLVSFQKNEHLKGIYFRWLQNILFEPIRKMLRISKPDLNIPKDVTKAQRPSWIIVATHSIDCDCDVNGDATDASRSESEIPTEACFRAPVSFAPSPQKTVT